MNKRIKTVWMLAIATMALMICGQGYWLYNLYVYSTDEQMKLMKASCDRAIDAEFTLRDKKKNEKDTAKDTVSIQIEANLNQDPVSRKVHAKQVYTYKLHGKSQARQISIDDPKPSTGLDILNRYTASKKQRFSKAALDSLLRAEGYGEALNFKFVRSDEIIIPPAYECRGGLCKTLHVRHSNNPLEHEVVEFDIKVPMKPVIFNMAWQLAGSLLLIALSTFCLIYQIRTIMIQKRIDGIRREFLKNMIYEMKQPPASEQADDGVRIGHTDFYYSQNELRHGNERVIITSRQAEILQLLAASPNAVVERGKILKQVWGDDSYSNSLALNVQISYLRRAFKSDASVSIEPVIRKGYMLRTC